MKNGLEHPTLVTLRRVLMVMLVIGLAGTGVELLLLGHTEGWQRVPLVLIACALVVLAWHGVARRRASLLTLRTTMALFVVAGVAGLLLHYNGNVEFELEMYPSLGGWELFREAVTGATPALAPGTMIQLGLLGVAFTYRHPALRRRTTDRPITQEN